MTICLFFPLVMELLVSLVFQMTSEFVYQVIAKSQVKDILLYCISRLFNYLQTSIKSQTCNFVSCFVYSSLQQCMTLPFIGRKILNWVISSNHNSGTQTCMLLKSPVDAGTMVCYKGNFQNKYVIYLWRKGNSAKVVLDRETNTAATMLWDKALLLYCFLNSLLHPHYCQVYEHKLKMCILIIIKWTTY